MRIVIIKPGSRQRTGIDMPALASSSDHAEAIVAGTLCLMSCFARTPSLYHARRIAANLGTLAHDAGVSAEMRTLCRRLAERWDAVALELEVPPADPPKRDLH
jgi:hypothetical protein